MCGENTGFWNSTQWQFGSPPRVRGKQRFSPPVAASPRITPACAGKTRSGITITVVVADHPRVCGENAINLFSSSSSSGSPPRVRGKPNFERTCLARWRITPACAGKTEEMKRRSLLKADHPRVCGENAMNYLDRAADDGSPPPCAGKTTP